MKIKWKQLLIAIAIPLAVGGLSALISGGGFSDTFNTLNKPPLSPPAILFPIVWSILYILMGIASYLVYTSNERKSDIKAALNIYGVQLIFNFFWSIIFFNLERYYFAFVWIVVLWLLIIVTMLRFYKISKIASYLLLPYLIWVTFATYLNLGIAILN